MNFSNPVKAAENLQVLSTESFQPSSRPTFAFKQIFVGPNGLRAGWRVLMFITLFAVLLGGFVLIRAGGPEAFREQYWNQSHITITPLLMGGSEAITLLFLCIAALVMGKLEHRKFGEYAGFIAGSHRYSFCPAEGAFTAPGLFQPWKRDKSPAFHASRSPGVLRSQSGRISLVTTRRSCHRSMTDGRPQNQ
jgi:hypothetical protein